MARPQIEDDKAHAVQIELLRSAGLARRFGLARSLTATTIDLAREAIHRRHPEWTEREVMLEFVRVHYGDDLAARVRAYLLGRR